MSVDFDIPDTIAFIERPKNLCDRRMKNALIQLYAEHELKRVMTATYTWSITSGSLDLQEQEIDDLFAAFINMSNGSGDHDHWEDMALDIIHKYHIPVVIFSENRKHVAVIEKMPPFSVYVVNQTPDRSFIAYRNAEKVLVHTHDPDKEINTIFLDVIECITENNYSAAA